MVGFHFSIDDVFDCLIELADRNLPPERQPVLAFCAALAAEGAVTDLYLFRRSRDPLGRVRSLDEVGEVGSVGIRSLAGIRFGPHAEDYATAPHAQDIEAQRHTMEGLFGAIDRFAGPGQRARWLRLHYFSECFELAPLWRAEGVEALMTTDKPAVAYRLPIEQRDELQRAGRTEFGGIGFVRSHLRLETFAEEAADPPRFLGRIDAALTAHGFVTLFTHEVDIADPRVRLLAMASIRHLTAIGAVAL